MESLSFKIGLKFAALIVFASFSNGLTDQCTVGAYPTPTAISCNISSHGASLLDPVICPQNDEIPLPYITPLRCNAIDKKWQDVKCYYAGNVASGKRISNGGEALVDGNLNTSVNIISREQSWDIWLGQQFAVYAVYILFLQPFPQDARVRVQTRQQFDGTRNSRIYNNTDCRWTSISDDHLRIVFYCLPNNTINDNQTLSGRITQNVEVTVISRRNMVELAEIQVLENQGHECGKPSQPGETVYNPNKSRYSVGEQVEYSCKNSSFVIFGSRTRYCGVDGRWAGYAPLCRQNTDAKNRCGVPESPLNSNFTSKKKSGLLEAVYTCDPMFRLSKCSESSAAVCTDGQWGRPPICERIYCRNYPPEIDARGADLIWKLSPYSSDPGAIARYVRSDGSEPSPPVLRTCNNDGQWEVTISPKNDQTATIAASVSIVLLIVIVIIVFIFRRRRFRNSARASAQNYFSDSSGIHFRNELPAGGPPLLLPNRHDSTIYEEIENVYDYDEIGNMKGEGCYDDASKNQVGPSHPNEYSSKQLLDTSGSLFPRPPPVIPK